MAKDPATRGAKKIQAHSYFAQKLESDPKLAARCEEVAKSLRTAVDDDIRAVEQSEQLTKDDFAIYINTRADSTMAEED